MYLREFNREEESEEAFTYTLFMVTLVEQGTDFWDSLRACEEPLFVKSWIASNPLIFSSVIGLQK